MQVSSYTFVIQRPNLCQVLQVVHSYKPRGNANLCIARTLLRLPGDVGTMTPLRWRCDPTHSTEMASTDNGRDMIGGFKVVLVPVTMLMNWGFETILTLLSLFGHSYGRFVHQAHPNTCDTCVVVVSNYFPVDTFPIFQFPTGAADDSSNQDNHPRKEFTLKLKIFFLIFWFKTEKQIKLYFS